FALLSLSLLITTRSPRPTLFPYTTLFRSKVDRELALMGLLRETIPKLAPWERVTFTHVAREEDANNLSLTVKALGRFEDLQSVQDRKSTRLNSSHVSISYAVFCLKKKTNT